MITQQEYDIAIENRKASETTINAFHKQKSDHFKERWYRFDHLHEFFKNEDLVYSAAARCKKCNAGLAYPKDCDPMHQWTCSAVLKGQGTDKGHEALPFAYYEVKSENQLSAGGSTTRPN